jgi:hypothetical protein
MKAMEKQSKFFTLPVSELHHISKGILTTSEIL